MTAILRALGSQAAVQGRHLVVLAHPDDEAISCAALLSLAVEHVRLVYLTNGVPSTTEAPIEPIVSARERERCEAARAAGWSWPARLAGYQAREAWAHQARLLALVGASLEGVGAVWTHPYEGGHLDHDTAAWLVQTATQGRDVARMEFASYYHGAGPRSVFGAFWPDPVSAAMTVDLTGPILARKRAAVAAYASQGFILRKFQTPEREAYRVAPVYDFTRPAAPPACRWDVKGYRPSSADWRARMAQQVAA